MRPKTLLIDDELDFVRLLAERLLARDFPVLWAVDAAQGIGLVESEAPAAVVLDVNLPDRSGLEVLGEIKERWPLVQVVMLTGQSDVATAVRGMKLGAVDYLVKPVNFDQLVRVLVRAGERRLNQEESLRMIETGKLAALGRLAEGVAHEINNPVNIMMQKAGWAGDLLEEPEFAACAGLAEVQAELAAIVVQGRRCRDIVSKLMSLGGRVDPRTVDFDPRQAAASALDLVRERAASLNVEIKTEFDPSVALVRLPRAEIEQVVGRLADNALDAMAEAGGTLTVRVRNAAAATVGIEVSDTGPGVDDSLSERIFEPFFSTKEVGKGSGLGLSICHGVMKSLGGSVELARSAQAGATFLVTLPVSPSPSPANG